MSDKYNKEMEGEVVCCMIEGLGLVVGKMKEKETGVPTLKNPRVVQHKAPDKHSQQVELRFAEMIGAPDELLMVRNPVFLYKVMDKKLKELWMKSTTSLVLAGGGGLQ